MISTAPDEATAQRLARQLLQTRCAACVNIVPGVRSLYWWQGAIEDATELLLLIKTTRHHAPAAQQQLAAQHPYEVPECIVLPIEGGLPAYLGWVAGALASEPGGTGKAPPP